MEKLTTAQREARKDSANAYINAESKRKDALGVSKQLTNLACTYSGETSELGLKMRADLASGRFKKPSDFAKAELTGLFGKSITCASIPSRKAGTAVRSAQNVMISMSIRFALS